MKKTQIAAINLFLITIMFFLLLAGCSMSQKSGSKISNTENGYAYNSLNDTEKKAYMQMRSCIENHTDSIALSVSTESELFHVYKCLLADHGEYFWLAGYKYEEHTLFGRHVRMTFYPKYTMSKKDAEKTQSEIDNVVTDIMNYISIYLSDYEKAKFVFSYLAWNVNYSDSSINNQNIISVFLEKEAVCQGYASATQYLLGKLGIQSTIITGTLGDNISHAWNLVKLDDEYYYMDTTLGNYSYSSESSDKYRYVHYGYMAMTDAMVKHTHSANVCFPLPTCNSLTDNYYVKEHLYCDHLDYDKIGQSYRNAWKSKKGTEEKVVTYMFSTSEQFDEAISYFMKNQHVFDYCEGLDGIRYLASPELNILTVIL